jgi:hypothetical protein
MIMEDTKGGRGENNLGGDQRGCGEFCLFNRKSRTGHYMVWIGIVTMRQQDGRLEMKIE